MVCDHLYSGLNHMGPQQPFFMFAINKLYLKDVVNEGFKAKSARIGTIEQVSMSLGFPVPTTE
jgi:hypothetical protein